MKKLLSIMCCVLCMDSFSEGPLDTVITSPQKASGEKVLIKAIALIVNPEANKKAPVKKINTFSSECP